MKRKLQNITAWVLLLCLTASTLSPLFSHAESKGYVTVKLDAHDESLPGEGKEEKSERLKTFSIHLERNPIIGPGLFALRYFEHSYRTKRQIFLPIILPPPKVLA